jgi:hypothetical protein
VYLYEAHGGVLSAQAQVLCGLEAARGVGDRQREADAEADADAEEKGAATNFTDMAGYGREQGNNDPVLLGLLGRV